jgi:hypothetical protein
MSTVVAFNNPQYNIYMSNIYAMLVSPDGHIRSITEKKQCETAGKPFVSTLWHGPTALLHLLFLQVGAVSLAVELLISFRGVACGYLFRVKIFEVSSCKMLATLSFQNGLRFACVTSKLVYFVLRSDPDNTTHPGGWS